MGGHTFGHRWIEGCSCRGTSQQSGSQTRGGPRRGNQGSWDQIACDRCFSLMPGRAFGRDRSTWGCLMLLRERRDDLVLCFRRGTRLRSVAFGRPIISRHKQFCRAGPRAVVRRAAPVVRRPVGSEACLRQRFDRCPREATERNDSA